MKEKIEMMKGDKVEKKKKGMMRTGRWKVKKIFFFYFFFFLTTWRTRPYALAHSQPSLSS